MKNKKHISQYINEVKRLRPYVSGFESSHGFDIRKSHDWKPHQKALITRYAKMFAKLSAGSNYVYRPRLKSHLKTALENRNVSSYRRFKVAFIPVPKAFNVKTQEYYPIKPHITFTKKGAIKLRIKEHGVTSENIDFSSLNVTPEEFLNDPQAVLEEKLSRSDYNVFGIMAGEHMVGRGVTLLLDQADLIAKLEQLMSRYGADNYDLNDTSSSHYNNWLFGLTGYKFDTVTKRLSYMESETDHDLGLDKYRDAVKKVRAKISRQEAANRKLARNKYINAYVHRQAQQDITRALKTARDKGPLLELRKYLKANKGEKLPDFIRLFMQETRDAKIAKFNDEIAALAQERLNYNRNHNQ